MDARKSYLRKQTCATLLGLACALTVGCQPFDHYTPTLKRPLPTEFTPPRELSYVSLPEYRIEPPDVLQIEVLKLIPKTPYRISIFDTLMVNAVGTIPEYPLNDYFVVDELGNLNLGPVYGSVCVQGLTPDEAKIVVKNHLKKILAAPEVALQVARVADVIEMSGIYLVQQDGIVNMRQCGAVHVSGMTISEAKVAIEKQLSYFFDSPDVTINVAGFNSKTYSIIIEDSTAGENVIRLPVTGKETVLDAISMVGGLKRASSQRIWIARPAPGETGEEQILPVDYMAVTRGGATTTNYQLMPGDRIFVAEEGWLTTTDAIATVTEPMRRVLGLAQLGITTVGYSQIMGRGYNQTRNQ